MSRKQSKKKKSKIKNLKSFSLIFLIILSIFLLVNFSPKKEDFSIEIISPLNQTDNIHSIVNFSIEIISPLNQTYNTDNIYLIVNSSKDVKSMSNSIDGSENITACYNCNSYGVYYLKFSKGAHIFTAYANDYENNAISKSVVFTVV